MASQRTRTPSILVADDNRPNRELLCLWLEAEGYEAISAEDGSQALNLLRSGQIDLALLDVLMPGHSGFAVCRVIKSQPDTRLVPVVLVTGLANSEDRIQGIESGADDFLCKPVRQEELIARVRSLLRLKQFTDELENAETVLCSLALSIEAKDPYTEGHCNRLAKLSVALAEHLNLPQEDCVALRRAGIVHDIGKVAVPEHILLKPGPLTPEERQFMEQHPVIGERICAPLRSFRTVLPIIRHHHERLDGSGYPDRLKDGQIPVTAQILTTADVFDSLTTDRPYRKALPLEDAFRVMNEEVRRGWWNKEFVERLEFLMCSMPTPILSRSSGPRTFL